MMKFHIIPSAENSPYRRGDLFGLHFRRGHLVEQRRKKVW